MIPDAPLRPNTSVYRYMPAQHVEAFKRAAARFKAWIMVRRGNPTSLRWIGKPGYIPKPLDCKAKTADQDVNGKECAGLVASPKLLPGAFSSRKFQDAMAEWPKFEPHLYAFDPKDPAKNLASDKVGKHFTLQMDASHKHYGCVLFKPVFRAQSEYIHADYDLYAVVPAANPAANVFVRDASFGGQPHSRSPLFFDVQYFFKAAGILTGQSVGTPMIQHGEQETFKTDWDEKLDVFWPDGKTISDLLGEAEIRDFYDTTLEGRQQASKNSATRPVFGSWVQTPPKPGR